MLTSETNYLNHFHSLNPLNSSYSGSLLNNSSERGVQLSSTLVVVAIYFQNITYKLHLSKSRTPDQITQNTATSTQTNTVIGKKKTFSIFRNRFSFFSHLRGNNVSAGLSLHAVMYAGFVYPPGTVCMQTTSRYENPAHKQAPAVNVSYESWSVHDPLITYLMGGVVWTALNIPLSWVKSDGTWVLHASRNQCRPHFSVKLGNLNLVQITINPVQLPCDPVHSKALWSGQAVLNNHLNSGHS